MIEWRHELPGKIVLAGTAPTMRAARREIRRRLRTNRRLRRTLPR